MQYRQWPGEVGGGVQRAPHPRAGPGSEPLAQDSGNQDEDKEIRGNGAQAHKEHLALGQEGHERVTGVRPVGDYLERYVIEQRGQREE